MSGSNYFTSAFDQIEKDERMMPSHIAIYIVLLNLWSKESFQNPMNITRREILSAGKVKSKATYHKCMKELHEYGYIKYDPTYDPFKGSSITMAIFGEHVPSKKTSAKKEILIRVSIEALS